MHIKRHSAVLFFAVLHLFLPSALAAQVSNSDALAVMKAAVEYVRPKLPDGQIVVDLDPKHYYKVDGEMVEYRPFEMPPQELAAPLAQALGPRFGARQASETLRLCDGPTERVAGNCTAGALTVTQPMIEGDQAQVWVIWTMPSGRHDIGYGQEWKLLLGRAGGEWKVAKVLDGVIS